MMRAETLTEASGLKIKNENTLIGLHPKEIC
jgi:hypothetical protein